LLLQPLDFLEKDGWRFNNHVSDQIPRKTSDFLERLRCKVLPKVLLAPAYYMARWARGQQSTGSDETEQSTGNNDDDDDCTTINRQRPDTTIKQQI
jgi:hypothetical protein